MEAAAGHSDPVRLAEADAFHLGALEVIPARLLVSAGDGRDEILEPRVMKVLVALARAGGAILAHEELLRAWWPGVRVGQDALARVIGRLRRLSEGVGSGAFVVETITKVGYRLKAIQSGMANSRDGFRPALPLPDRPSIAVLPFKPPRRSRAGLHRRRDL